MFCYQKLKIFQTLAVDCFVGKGLAMTSLHCATRYSPDSEMGDGADECDTVEWLLDTVDEEHSDTERLFDREVVE